MLYLKSGQCTKGYTLNTHYNPQVSGNGLFLFGRSANFYRPVLFPNSTSYNYIVAPFWADNDLRPSGRVSYEVHNISTDYLSSVNRYIRQQSGSNFEGSWMLVVDWKDVAEYQSDIDKVSGVIK